MHLASCYLKHKIEHHQDSNKENSHQTKAEVCYPSKMEKVIVYHKNGKVQSIGHFTNGIANGPIIVYDSNGNELYRGRFENGKPSGEWIFTNPKKIMKKQSNLIDISLFNFSNDNFLHQYHPIPFHFIVLIKFKK